MLATSCTRESCTRGLVHRGDQFRLRVFSRGLGSSRDLYHVIRDGEMICVMRVISKIHGRPLLNSLGNLCLTKGILWSSVGFNTQIIYHLMVHLNFSYSCTVMVQLSGSHSWTSLFLIALPAGSFLRNHAVSH